MNDINIVKVIKRGSILLFVFIAVSCTSKSYKAKRARQNKKHSTTVVNKKGKSVKDYFPYSQDFFLPTSTTGQVVHHQYMSISYSEKHEQPEWVAYKITLNNLNENVKRTNNYREDPGVKTNSAHPKDYYKSGYDMGHLAPAKTMAHNKQSMSESFYLSNISPQKPGFNRGIWKRLEQKVRYWASFNDSMFVVTGPVLNAPIGRIGSNDVAVPRAFFKTLIAYKNGEVKGLGFVLNNEKSNKSLYTYIVSIDAIEKITGIDFYSKIETKIQEEAEANVDIKKWFIKK